LPFERAVAGSIYIIGVTAGAAAAVYLARGDVHVSVAGATMLGTVVGASLTAAWGVRLDQRLLKLGFALLLVVVAIRMVGRGIAQF
ncbi:MAG: TSUP family transporter, partial [Gemmatimonadota bacterium]|nr:TSUP family transporter [Gemmatimonadota bacterium]